MPLAQLIEPGRVLTYGVVQPGPPVSGGVPIVRVADVRDGRVSTSGVLRISPEIEAPYGRSRLRGGELLLTVVGTVGETVVAPDALAGWNTARGVAVIPVRKDVGSIWVRLALQGPEARRAINSRLNTTVQATLNLDDVARLPIPMPSAEERQRILRHICALDDKVELNRRMNETLEAIARTLFKSWFVDFDPVRAKAEGRDPGLPAHLASVFPDSFEHSELGEIPTGWRTARLGDATTFPLVSPGVPRPDGAQVQYIATGDVQHNVVVGETGGIIGELPSRANMQPGHGRIWFARMKESPKHLWTMGEDQSWWARRVLSTGFAGIQARPRQLEALLYEFISSPAFDEAKNGLATGTTMQAMNNETLGTIRVVVPDPAVASLFDQMVRPIYRRVWQNHFETRTLANLRDSLLPELLAGRTRVALGAGLAEAET